MSVQFGRWNFDGKPVDRDFLEKAKASIAPYGPDDAGAYSKNDITIVYHAFHTTNESRRETQPHVTSSNAVITWDGRLDNRADLIQQLRNVVTIASADVAIVAAAYEHWGSDCIAMLIGDWALSLWDPHTHSLILAKDPIGTRHLYYCFGRNQVTWSSILDPLVLFASKTFKLEEEYIAGWLSFFPTTHLTPYVGIHAVPPSSLALIRAGTHTIRKYWDFDPSKRIRYNTDSEYEEHFRTVFAEAVRRRLRSDRPILAELSGGLDSSSIVCMADILIARGVAETSKLDTISYYDDSEPNLNECPYFTKVEEQRGRIGHHIDFNTREFFKRESEIDGFTLFPSASRRPNRAAKEFMNCITSQGNRVVLSGIGGDEVTGGVPTPTPEIQDLIATASFRALAHQLKVWALNKRKPWFHLFFEAAREFLPAALVGIPRNRRPAPWLNPAFVNRNRASLHGYESRLKLFGALPSFRANLNALDGLRRQIECDVLPSQPSYEKRYPYLDRGLLEFLYAIPRQQVVRAGQRRSLMRRALVGIVPEEVLERKRKAFVARAPMAAISNEWASLVEISRNMVSASLGVVNQESFSQSLQKARNGQAVPLVPLMRTVYLEFWLRSVSHFGILDKVGETPSIPLKRLTPSPISAEKN
jgi:asparagine synthase (glutamine-hydrolysing)